MEERQTRQGEKRRTDNTMVKKEGQRTLWPKEAGERTNKYLQKRN